MQISRVGVYLVALAVAIGALTALWPIWTLVVAGVSACVGGLAWMISSRHWNLWFAGITLFLWFLGPQVLVGTSSTVSLAGPVILVWWAVTCIRRRRLERTNLAAMGWGLALLLAYVVLGSLASLVDGGSPMNALAAAQWAVYASTAWLWPAGPAQWRRLNRQVMPLLACLYFLATIISAFTGPFYPWLQITDYPGSHVPGGMRALGTAESPNAAGVNAVLLLGLGLLTGDGRSWVKTGLAVLGLIAVILTASRVALVSLVVGLLFVLVVSGRLVSSRAVGTLAGGGVLLLAGWAMFPGHAQRLLGIGDYSYVTDYGDRLHFWLSGLNRFLDSSLVHQLLGGGFRNSLLANYSNGRLTFGNYHNSYIHALLDLGEVGLGLWLVVMTTLLVAALKLARRKVRAGLAAVWLIVVMTTQAMTELYLYSPGFAMMIGLAAVLAVRAREELLATATIQQEERGSGE